MQNLRSRFSLTPKKTFLIKLVSILGFGGMVGFCVLGCDKQAGSKNDVVKGSEPVKVGTSAEANVEKNESGEVVLEPEVKPRSRASDLEISDVYGPPRRSWEE